MASCSPTKFGSAGEMKPSRGYGGSNSTIQSSCSAVNAEHVGIVDFMNDRPAFGLPLEEMLPRQRESPLWSATTIQLLI